MISNTSSFEINWFFLMVVVGGGGKIISPPYKTLG
jgi:hypothetical protein